MNISIQVRIDNSVLKNVIKNGLFPDSLENIVIMRVKDAVRRVKTTHGKIIEEVIRSDKLIGKLYQVNINIESMDLDKSQLTNFLNDLIESFYTYGSQIRDVDILVS